MKRSLVVQVALAVVVSGCGVVANSAPNTSDAVSVKRDAPAREVKEKVVSAAVESRRVGDFFVHRFSGSFAKSPLTLSEEVIGREGDLWVVDYALEDGTQTTRIRVREDSRDGDVVRVSRVEGGREIEANRSVFEELLARTSFAADANVALLGSAAQTCVVGPSELECETKNYRVMVGDKEATLSVSASAKLPGRDIGGEITAADGSVIYRAEIVEMGRQKAGGSRSGAGVAIK